MTVCPHCVAVVAAGAAAPYATWKLYRPVIDIWSRGIKANAGLALRASIVAAAVLAAPVF